MDFMFLITYVRAMRNVEFSFFVCFRLSENV